MTVGAADGDAVGSLDGFDVGGDETDGDAVGKRVIEGCRLGPGVGATLG